MTDRINSLTVVLEEDMRADDAQSLIDAILHLRGVAEVATNVSDHTFYLAQTRARLELWNKLMKVISPEFAIQEKP